MLGHQIDYKKHVYLEFGSYVQTHEEHDNGMEPCTIGAICLGPTGNEQGGHYFMSLSTGCRLYWEAWMELPMPQDAIDRVGTLGQCQNMPKNLMFANHYGFEIPNVDDDVDDDHDSTYDPDTASIATSNHDDSISYASTDGSDVSSDDDDDDDNDADDGAIEPTQPLPGLNAGVDDTSIMMMIAMSSNDMMMAMMTAPSVESGEESDEESDNEDDNRNTINVPDVPTPSKKAGVRESTTENTGVGGQTIGDDLNGIAENTGVGAEADGWNIEVEDVDEEDDDDQSALEHEMDE